MQVPSSPSGVLSQYHNLVILDPRKDEADYTIARVDREINLAHKCPSRGAGSEHGMLQDNLEWPHRDEFVQGSRDARCRRNVDQMKHEAVALLIEVAVDMAGPGHRQNRVFADLPAH